jgi:hypothetical protein
MMHGHSQRRIVLRGAVASLMTLQVPLLASAQGTTRAAPSANAITRDRVKIVQLYERLGRAHAERDADAFVGAYDTAWTVISNGKITRRRREQARHELREYLSSTRFTELTEIQPPLISIAPDNRSARLMGWVRVRGEMTDSSGVTKAFAFEAAWLDVLEQRQGRWVITVHANTERPLAAR